MAIAVRAATAVGAAASGTSITMTVPAGVVNGDVLVMTVSAKSATVAPTLPSGWTTVVSLASTTSNLSQLTCWRVASAEPASYVVTTPSAFSAGTMIALSGASSAPLVAAQSSILANASSATVSAATLGTFTSSNGIDLFLAGMGSLAAVPAAPTNYVYPTVHTAKSGGTSSTAVESDVAYRALTAVTTVGAVTATWSGAGGNMVSHVFIMEGAGGPATPTAHNLTMLGVGQ